MGKQHEGKAEKEDIYILVVVCTDLSGKLPHRQIGVGRMVIPGSLGDLMNSTLAHNAKDLGSIPILCTTLPIFITTPTLLYILCRLYIYIYIFVLAIYIYLCLYVFTCIGIYFNALACAHNCTHEGTDSLLTHVSQILPSNGKLRAR